MVSIISLLRNKLNQFSDCDSKHSQVLKNTKNENSAIHEILLNLSTLAEYYQAF